ncbi:MAG TPA: hypothetical protein VM010_03630, partial [Chitinophagaceae bacterium]|nr:hypothetical protein [Chitinophagaceae bacterium]
MKKIFDYVKDYIRSLVPPVFLTCTVFIAVAIFCNYYFGLDAFIDTLTYVQQLASWYVIFLLAFGGGYFIEALFEYKKLFQNPIFVLLL